MNCIPIAITNDRAAKLGFRIKRGASLSQRFRFKKEDGTYLQLTGLLPVMVVRDGPEEALRYEIGNGFTVDPLDATVLVMEKLAGEKNIRAKTYAHEMLMPFSGTDKAFMWEGYYTSIETLIPL